MTPNRPLKGLVDLLVDYLSSRSTKKLNQNSDIPELFPLMYVMKAASRFSKYIDSEMTLIYKKGTA